MSKQPTVKRARNRLLEIGLLTFLTAQYLISMFAEILIDVEILKPEALRLRNSALKPEV
jgi:hypothetical protein